MNWWWWCSGRRGGVRRRQGDRRGAIRRNSQVSARVRTQTERDLEAARRARRRAARRRSLALGEVPDAPNVIANRQIWLNSFSLARSLVRPSASARYYSIRQSVRPQAGYSLLVAEGFRAYLWIEFRDKVPASSAHWSISVHEWQQVA